MLARLSVFVAIAVFSVRQAESIPCSDYQTVPSLLPLAKYFTINREAGMQIFTNSLMVPCDGHVVAWKFIPPNTEVTGLHLAVFRPDASSYVGGIPRKYTIAGETRIDGLSITNKQQWTTLRLADSIPVKEGDSLGIFYDDYRTEADKLGVGIASTPDAIAAISGFGSEKPSTLVLISDSSVASTGSRVDASAAAVLTRLGGLAAVLHPSATNSSRCVLPLELPDVSCSSLQQRYSFQNATCKQFNGCPRFGDSVFTANNFRTIDECMRNCSRLLPENQRGAFDATDASKLEMAGQTPATEEPRPETTEAPPTTPAIDYNPRCTKPMELDDWTRCSQRRRRHHYNVYLGYCVSFSGCDPGLNNDRNNWATRDECNANCVFVRQRYLRSGNNGN